MVDLDGSGGGVGRHALAVHIVERPAGGGAWGQGGEGDDGRFGWEEGRVLVGCMGGWSVTLFGGAVVFHGTGTVTVTGK